MRIEFYTAGISKITQQGAERLHFFPQPTGMNIDAKYFLEGHSHALTM